MIFLEAGVTVEVLLNDITLIDCTDAFLIIMAKGLASYLMRDHGRLKVFSTKSVQQMQLLRRF